MLVQIERVDSFVSEARERGDTAEYRRASATKLAGEDAARMHNDL
jgi:hypothetical protein